MAPLLRSPGAETKVPFGRRTLDLGRETASILEGAVMSAGKCISGVSLARASDRASLPGPDIVIVENADRGSLHVVILAAPQRPEKGCERGEAEQQRHGDQVDQHGHGDRAPGAHVCAEAADPGARSSPRRRTRNALTVTRIEEPDIATAAISGVTKPAIAIGTAIAL